MNDPLALLGVVLTILTAAGLLWVYPAVCISRIAAKVGTTGRWMAWIPILNMVLVCRIGGLSGWWVLLCLIPYVGVIVALLLMLQLPKALGVTTAARFLIVVPLVNFVYLGYLAFREDPTQSGTVVYRPIPDPVNEEDYVRSCAETAFPEEKEERTFRSDPAFQRVLDPLNSQQYSAAIKAAESLLPRFLDFDLPYKWLASACLSTDKLQRSQEVLAQGLAKAKRKSLLLTDMGETEWRMGNVHQAVYWWCQALHCLSSNPIDYNAYLLLSYVAKGCGLGGVEQRLLGRVDAMRAGLIRLDPATADRLTSLVRSKKSSAMIRAVQGIAEKYLPAA